MFVLFIKIQKNIKNIKIVKAREHVENSVKI